MRITFITPHISISGGVHNILTFANLLSDRGHTVNVVTLPPGLNWQNLKTQLRFISRHPRTLLRWEKLHSFLRRNLQSERDPKWIDLRASLLFVPAFEEALVPDADIIVSAGGLDGPIVARYNRAKGRKFVFFQHFGAHGITKTEEAVAKMPFRKLVLSSWIGDLLKERFDEDSILVRCPIETDLFYPVDQSKKTNPIIGMLHHTFEWKGLADGLTAFQEVRKVCPSVELVMFGCHGIPAISSAPYCSFFHDPPQEKLREIYSMCDIWVCPSWTEGFGMTSAEALACKTALVTTDNGGSRDFAFHEQTALVSPARNPSQLAQNIIRLLEDHELREQVAVNGYNLIQGFNWNETTDIMEKAFREALK